MIDHSDRWWPAYTSNAVYAGRDLHVPATASIHPRERRMSSAAESPDLPQADQANAVDPGEATDPGELRPGNGRPLPEATVARLPIYLRALYALAERGVALRPLFIDGLWREIDTEQDLASAEKTIPTWT